MKNSFSELKLDELLAKRDELRKKYFDLRFQHVVGHVENPLEKRNLRRMIARVEARITGHLRAGEVAKAGGAK
ncbi:MAG TPA: 50S ribosomal protein L29 [Rectinemataceae bacterium]|nr:50S ribosomal protein L29 [Rectinemataceae bacterium]